MKILSSSLILCLFLLVGCNGQPSTSLPGEEDPSETTSGVIGDATTGDSTGGSVGGTAGGTEGGTTGGTSTGSSSGGTSSEGTAGGIVDGTISATVIEDFLTLVNDHRATIGAKPLVHSTAMDSIARVHSENMANKTAPYSHDGIQDRCYQAVVALGGGFTCAENIIGAVETADQLFSFWMSSPGHRANIENPALSHMGLGWKKSPDTFYYWTLLFLGK